MAKGGVTITELALRAGVSAATVSIVLNRKPLARRVPEHTQLRIRELAEQLSYRPSHFAQAMKKRSTGIYGFVCGDVGTPFYAELTECLMREADLRGCRLMTMPTEWDVGREIRTLETLLTRMVDGVVMCSQAFEQCSEETERIKRAYGGILPLVTVNAESEGVSSVIYDFRPGMRDLLEYFAGCGIRQLVMLDDPAFPRKRAACMEFAPQFGIGLELVDFSFGSMESLDAAVGRILDKRPEAVLGTSDFVTMRFCAAAGERGLRIPDDVSVATIDCSKMSGFYNPSLTGIRIDPAEFTGQVFDELERKIAGAPELRSIVVPGRLMVRRSVKTVSR